jgi:hypothetical protein
MPQPYLFISFTALLLTPSTRKRPPQSGSVQTAFSVPIRLTSPNPVSGQCARRMLLGALCPVQLGYDMACSRQQSLNFNTVLKAGSKTASLYSLLSSKTLHRHGAQP